MNIAIVGATGNVGRKIIEVLEKRELSIDRLYLVASSKSAGSKIKFKGKEHEVFDLENFDFSKAKITFFAAGGKISEKFVEKVSKNSVVIDNSSAWRMDPDVPLVVPEVNASEVDNVKKGIIANPNCSTIQMVVALKPLHDVAKIKRVVVSTYQSVSGGGKKNMDELWEQTKSVFHPQTTFPPVNFTKQIAFNVIPHIDVFMDGGDTKEEWKMKAETMKILDKSVKVTATCVRVPTFVGHAESLNIEFHKEISADKARSILRESPGLIVIDQPEENGYITPIECVGEYATFVSRIREDSTQDNTLNMWCVSDNLRKGAALNTVQIAESMINRGFKTRF